MQIIFYSCSCNGGYKFSNWCYLQCGRKCHILKLCHLVAEIKALNDKAS